MAAELKDRLARQAAGDTDLGFDPLGTDEARLVSILLDLIDPDPQQPRKTIGDLTELALSIREHGVINPIIVEVSGSGRYRIIAGERRFAACRSLGLRTVPCIVRTVADQSRLILQLIENLQRKDLHPVEEARAFKRLSGSLNSIWSQVTVSLVPLVVPEMAAYLSSPGYIAIAVTRVVFPAALRSHFILSS